MELTSAGDKSVGREFESFLTTFGRFGTLNSIPPTVACRPKADTKQNKKTTPKSGWHVLTYYVVLKRIT